MADEWQSIEEAALTLGVSTRTLHRRIAKEEFQTRLLNGRREVLVRVPDVPHFAPPPPQTPVTPPADGDRQVYDATEESDPPAQQGYTHNSGTHHALALAEERLHRADVVLSAFRQSAMASSAEARQARQAALIAWSVVGLLLSALVVAAWWTSSRIHEARGDQRVAEVEKAELAQRVNEVQQTAAALKQDVLALQQSIEQARVAEARADGRLVATQEAYDRLMDVTAKPPSPVATSAMHEPAVVSDETPSTALTWARILQGMTTRPASPSSAPQAVAE